MKNVLPPPTANLATSLLGIWKLKSREDVDAEGKIHIDPVLGNDPIAILSFGPSHFAAQFMKRNRSQRENTPELIQPKNNTVAVGGYDAYFGFYVTDEVGGTITTHIEGSISPGNVGKTYVRNVRLVNNELVIQLETATIDGTPIIRTNTFSRVG
jgi:hypothetical protein